SGAHQKESTKFAALSSPPASVLQRVERRTWSRMSGPVRDVKDFWFKQLRKVEFGDPGVPGDARVSLLACSSLHGLTFVATRIGLCVFETAVLDEVNKTAGGPQSSHVDASLLKAKEFRTPSLPLHLSLSCDSLTLCLAWRDDSRISLNFFDVRAVVQATSSSLQPFCSIVPNTMQGAGLCGLKWNPTSPDLLAVSLSSGGVYVLEVKEDVKVLASKTDMGATSLCWSPKGKQLALGLKNGSVVQYNHKTSTQKCHACPDAFGGEPQQVADLHWVSTFLFAVVFTPVSGSGAPSSLFLSTPKDGPVAWTNFEDVYYGGSNRSYHFYFTYLSPWNLMMTSSANSMETVVFSQFGSGGADWEQWELDDTGRAEIPLKDGEDTHVAGMGLSLCSTCDVQIDDNLAIPPSPLLLLYSTAGVLCPFWLVHRDQQAAVVTPPTPLPSGPPRLATQPQLQSVAPGTQFTAGAILASSAAPVSSQTLPATPAPTTAFPQQAQSTPFGQTVFRLPPPASGQTPITSSVRPPPPASTIAFSQTPTTGSVRPPAPAGTTPFGQTPTTGSVWPPAPASTTPFGQTPTTGSIRPPAPASTTPFGQTPTTSSIRPPAPAGTIPFGQTPTTGSIRPPAPASTTPFGQTPTTSSIRPPAPASTTPFGQTPTTGSIRPPAPASTTPFGQTPTTGSIRPPAPGSTTPFGQTPTIGSIRPPAPASTTPFGQTATIGSIRPPAPAGTVPFGQTPTTGSIRLPAPASTTPLGPSDTSKRSSLGVTVRPVHPTSQQQPVSAPGTVRPPQPTAHQTLPPVSVTTSAVPHLSPPPLPPSSKASASVRQSKDDSRQLEATFSAHIREEIDRFVMELEDFKESVEGVLGEGWEEGERERGEVAGLGSVRDAVEVREEEEEVERDVQAAVNCVKELAETCDQLRDEVLRGLELSEKARVSVRRRGDMEHALRQKVRPLDPTNTKKLNDIRELFLRVDQKTGEVNGQLDAEIQKRRMDSLRGGRSVLRPPSIQTVYASLRDHNKIIKLQEERAAQVVRDVKRLRFIPMSWTPDQCRLPPPAMPTQRLTEQGGHGGEGRKDGGPQPEKLEKLREYLMNIEKTPVRRVGARPLPSATPSVLSVQSSGRSSPASSIPHYLVSGSKPHLYEKTRSSLAHVSALTPQDSSTYLDSQPTPETSRSPPPSPSPHPPSLSPQSIAPASLPPPSFAPPPSVSFSSGNTISWGVPTTAGGGVVSSGLSGAEGQVNLSSTSKPGDSGSGVVMPFPLSLLSSSSHPPPSSRPVISAQTPAGRSPFASTPLTSQTVAPSLFKPSLAHSPKETALLLGYSGQPSTKPQGTVFSLGSPGQPSTKPFPSSATGGGPVSFSSPFVFGATSQSSILSLSQVAGGPTFSPSTTSSSQLNQSVGSSVSPNPLPSVVSFSQTGVGSSRSSGIGTPTTVTLPAQSFALGFNTSHAVVSTSPSLATLASSKPPVSTVVSSAPPVSTVVSSAPPVSTVVSSAPPVSTVVSSTPPVSTVVSSTTPVSTVVSSKQPLTVTKLPLLSGTPSVPPTVSSTPSQTGVMSTAPLPAGDGDSTPQTTTLTLTNASTTPSVARAVPPATVTSVSLPSGHPQTSTGTDEIEDDMDQADVVSQSLAPVSSVGGGGFFGGLGSLGLGGTPRSSTTANPFGSFTSAAVFGNWRTCNFHWCSGRQSNWRSWNWLTWWFWKSPIYSGFTTSVWPGSKVWPGVCVWRWWT
ncbi:Nuclear pore complex protein Nup214, partial [Geodia barretti]